MNEYVNSANFVFFNIGPTVAPQLGNPHPLTKAVMPITMGHEFCGRIIQTSSSSSLKAGQAVMVDPRLYCSSCTRCDATGTNVCYSWGFKGFSGGGGGLSEVVAVEERMCHVLPVTVDLSIAALIEPLAVAVHALRCTGVESFADKDVLILGGGPVGLAVIMVLRMKGAKAIYVSEPTAKRQTQVREIADMVIDPSTETVGERCRELAGKKGGVDIVFDCAGNVFAMNDGMDALRWKGVYMNVAGWVKPVSFASIMEIRPTNSPWFVIPQDAFMFKELTIKCSLSYTDEDFRETVSAFSAGMDCILILLYSTLLSFFRCFCWD